MWDYVLMDIRYLWLLSKEFSSTLCPNLSYVGFHVRPNNSMYVYKAVCC